MIDENSLILTLIVIVSIITIVRGKLYITRPDVYISIIALVSFVLPQFYMNKSINWQTSLVFLVGYFAFLLPFVVKSKSTIKYKKLFLFNFKINNRLNLFSKIYFPLILILIYFAMKFRINNSVGLPGVESSMKFSGVFYYILTTGFFVFISSYFLFVQKHNKGKLLFMIMLFSYAFYQSTLGWRQGVFDVILLMVILSYNLKVKLTMTFKLVTVSVLLGVITLVVQLQNIFRGSEKTLIHTWERLFGIRYLDSVVGYFVNKTDNDLWFNDYSYLKLKESNLNSADFHNFIILGGNEDFINGAARTGFGSVFMLFGIIGVFFVFFLLGYYYKKLHLYYLMYKDNTFFTLFYSFNIIILQRILVEQFDYGVIIHYLSFVCFTYIVFRIYRVIGLKKIKIHAFNH